MVRGDTAALVGRKKKAGNPGMLRPAVVDAAVRDDGVAIALRRLRVAGVLYTYRCSATCRHCGFSCSPERPADHVSIMRLPTLLGDLKFLGRIVYVTGGECMLFWDELRAGLELAAKEGAPPHFVETNASFAATDLLVETRFRVLRDLGVRGVRISADPWHQEFVDPEQVIRARRVATAIFGPANVVAPGGTDEALRRLARVAGHPEALKEHLAHFPPRLSGRACAALADHFHTYPLARLPPDAGWGRTFRRRDCEPEFDRVTMGEIHVDPADRIVSNCGLVLGSAVDGGLRKLWRGDPTGGNFLARILLREGPVGLMNYAVRECSMDPITEARSKCDLCYRVRVALRLKHPDLVGPPEIY